MVAVGGLFFALTSGAAPDTVNCTGYPEPRIQLENQSWWDPQPGPASHPGTGKQGHIHVGMCFPLYQHLSGPILHLDVTVKLHNMPAIPSKIRVALYDDVTWNSGIVVPPCATNDCTYTYPLDVPIALARYSGWREIAVYLNVTNANAEVQRNWERWLVYLDNGKPSPPAGQAGSVLGNPGGDSWYSNVPGGTTGQYSQAQILRGDVPWDEATGQLTPLSGVWKPTAKYEAQSNFAYIDPALHAVPPSKGTVVYEAATANTGYHTQQLSIDTTALSNGVHRLVIGSGNQGTNGTNTGVLSVPFLVNNPTGCGQ